MKIHFVPFYLKINNALNNYNITWAEKFVRWHIGDAIYSANFQRYPSKCLGNWFRSNSGFIDAYNILMGKTTIQVRTWVDKSYSDCAIMTSGYWMKCGLTNTESSTLSKEMITPENIKMSTKSQSEIGGDNLILKDI